LKALSFELTSEKEVSSPESIVKVLIDNLKTKFGYYFLSSFLCNSLSNSLSIYRFESCLQQMSSRVLKEDTAINTSKNIEIVKENENKYSKKNKNKNKINGSNPAKLASATGVVVLPTPGIYQSIYLFNISMFYVSMYVCIY
jgi:hypothetical protein